MIKLVDYQTKKALPAEMQTPEYIALSYAYDKQKEKFLERMERVYIWADLEKVNDNKLDFLAVENRVIFYNTELIPNIKRNLIQNSIYWYMKLGTRQAMEEMISCICQNENTIIEEWYTYGGEPFHFKVIVNVMEKGKQINVEDLIKKIKLYKRSSARLDSVNVGKLIKTKLYIASGKEIFIKSKIGINPYYKTAKKIIRMNTVVSNLRYIKIHYPIS